MSEIDTLKADLAAIEAKTHAAIKKLEDEIIKAVEGLAFRLKQELHSVNYPAVDAQTAAATQALTSAIDAAHVAVTPVSSSDTPVTTDGTVIESPKLAAESTAAPLSADAGTDAAKDAAGSGAAVDEGKFDDGRV